MSLDNLVELYRYFKKPLIKNGGFEGEASYSEAILGTINAVRENSPGVIREFLIDGKEFLPHEKLPKSGTEIELYIHLPVNAAERIYSSVESLAETLTVARGIMPEKYYVASIDYFSPEFDILPHLKDKPIYKGVEDALLMNDIANDFNHLQGNFLLKIFYDETIP